MTASRLAALLDQATPGPWWYEGIASGIRHLNRNCEWYGEGLPEGYELPSRHEPDYRLIALAPDMARLLVDMAAYIDRRAKHDAPPYGNPEHRALLARFAEIERRAAQLSLKDDLATPLTRKAADEADAALAAEFARLNPELAKRAGLLALYRQGLEAENARLKGELTEWRTSIATEKLIWRAEAAEAEVARIRTGIARQLTPLDVATTHVQIIRSKGDDYTAEERDNVAAIVEAHTTEARSALFALLAEDGFTDLGVAAIEAETNRVYPLADDGAS